MITAGIEEVSIDYEEV
jgi:hypothetical protein